VPRAAAAAVTAFSVAVTLGSSRKTSAPRRPGVLSRNCSSSSKATPRRSSARKCVSSRRRPMTSPPGGGSSTRPDRASSGAASRMDARMRRHSSGSSSAAFTVFAWILSVFRCVVPHSMLTPTDFTSSTSASTSRMRGTFSSVIGCSLRTDAAMIGSAAFLFPDGRMVPESRRPPSTMYCSAPIRREG